jgi:hypothetical protein
LGLSAVVLALLLLAAAMLAGRSYAATASAAPTVSGATVRLPIVPGRPAAGHFTITGGAKADRLVGVSSPLAGRIELHSMTVTDGVMRMRAEPGFDVPARGKLAFTPGGNHLMLFDLKPGAKAGAPMPLSFTFASGARVNATASVTSGAPAAHGAGH